jgi:hypothetical protein
MTERERGRTELGTETDPVTMDNRNESVKSFVPSNFI